MVINIDDDDDGSLFIADCFRETKRSSCLTSKAKRRAYVDCCLTLFESDELGYFEK